MSYQQGDVTVNWSIHVAVRGYGSVQELEHFSGSATEATDAAIAFLESRRLALPCSVEGVAPSIEIMCDLTSPQLPAGRHRMPSDIDGLPPGYMLDYQIDWLRLNSRAKNWGGGSR